MSYFVEEDMNMNTELLNDTLAENFEETNWEVYNENESEIEEHETEVSEDTQRWADDGDLKRCLLREHLAGYFYGILSHKKVRPTIGKTFSRQTIPAHMVFNHLICTM
ncbi:hypothetical protein AVEN_143467-1 [Araneus ventricosus]|uniref:Uncharacterized protein n=1 Tax=Araneus ventricosus TaxID=182803 RepID=A0A4Y2LWH8_ARAVE|nr:hypothetical protein AVEN_143467-1 [Araneus ventricosus]